ncbi:bifunctional helix-turn-helix domain-containing protein/methylated-DNA--[protein]-cysteine S-methyltransferase [Flagellimonas sp.]|uniref:bifunctional helix-turn-helix domain-containing protein/methylated-DNA--[protein]-cysteine S-methyltransferase n=1 Tax=Flagellimonas sp. TaxID=2058762 RepID=UPI003AB55A4D
MNTQAEFNYDRVAKAISFIRSNFKEQPSLNEIAESVHLSPYHFQRLFTEWAGVSPKKFMQYISVEHAKKMLKETQVTLSEAAMETGFSGTGRLHDLFVNIEGMTPGEYKNGGENLEINFSFAESPFGKLIVASTPKGICHMAFVDDGKEGFEDLKSRFPNATYRQLLDKNQQDGLAIFRDDWSKQEQIKLHLHGTPFQLKVWETLLKIPTGSLEVYGSIAHKMERPKASRAVGTAIGKNPVAFLIPCHRVIQSTGKVGGYMWGSTRKSAIIGWEAAQMAPAE